MKTMNVIAQKRWPPFTIASFMSPVLVGVASYPIWSYYLRDSDPTGKGGMFVVVALIILTTLSVAVGSVFGLVFAITGHIKRERWLVARVLFMVANTLIAGYGIYTFCSLPRANPQAEQAASLNGP